MGKSGSQPGLAGKLVDLTSSSGVITPNGDAINDDLRITFDLLRSEVAAELHLYDLTGRLLRVVSGQPGETQVLVWDGTVKDKPAAPGIYVCRIEVPSDAQTWTQTLVVSVAY